MEKDNMQFYMLKDGTTKDDEGWLEMKTVNDIFQVAKTLSEEDRQKLIKEFANGIDVMVSMFQVASELSDDIINPDEIEMQAFNWIND